MSYAKSMRSSQVFKLAMGSSSLYGAQRKKITAEDVKESRLSPTVLADEIFDIEDGDCEVGYDDREEEFDANGAYLTDDYQGRQFELELESIEDVRNRMEHAMQKFERAYNKMAIYAMRWHFLMEDCKDDEQIAKMVRDLQVYRKLSGTGDPV